jgi:hypothetical protein
MVFFDGLLLKIVVIESQSLLSTVRTFNNTFIAIVFTLLGSVFGLMQTVGSVMSFVESSSKNIKNRIETPIRLGTIRDQRKGLDQNFYQNENPTEFKFEHSKTCLDLAQNKVMATL